MRNIATRTPSTRRVAVRDDKASLSFDGVGNKLEVTSDNILWGAGTVWMGRIKTNSLDKWILSGKSSVAGGDGFRCQITSLRKIKFFNELTVEGTQVITSTNSIKQNEWNNLGVAITSTALIIFLNGVITSVAYVGTINQYKGIIVGGAYIGTFGKLLIKDMHHYNSLIPNQQIFDDAFNGGIYPNNSSGEYLLNEGAGNPKDTSGNGNDGTLTGATWSSDTPSKKRVPIGANLIPNGDFSYVPPFVAATNVSGRYIDGSAAGSTTNTKFKYQFVAQLSTGSAQFDTAIKYNGKNSIKITNDDATAVNYVQCVEYMPVQPSTEYRVFVAVRTDGLLGTFAYFQEYSGAKAYVKDAGGTSNGASEGVFEIRTFTFTTSATTKFVWMQLVNRGGAAGASHFSDIQLHPTTPETRTKVTNTLLKTVVLPVDAGNAPGNVIELDSGRLVRITSAPVEIYVSDDAGANWTQKYANDHPNRYTQLHYLAKNGYLYIGTKVTGEAEYVLRSVDNGDTWTSVLTVESSATWGITENADGDIFIAEYSQGNQGDTELFGENVWVSTNDGATFAKWATFPHVTIPVVEIKDGIRHIHILFTDSSGQKYISFGEIGWGANGGRTYRLNEDGTLSDEIQKTGEGINGTIAACEAADGRILFGTDNVNATTANGIYSVGKNESAFRVNVDFNAYFGAAYGSPVYSIVKGKYGVLYAQTSGEGGKTPMLIMSPNDGTYWVKAQDFPDGTGQITVNTKRGASKVYMSIGSENNYISFKDYTKLELFKLALG